MKLMVISLLAFLLFPTIHAVEFTFNSPETASLEKPFQVSLSSDAPDECDVKIFVHNSSDSKIKQNEIISQIKNEGKWKDSWNYALSAFPSQKTYELNVIEQPGNRNICVRLRKTNQSLFEELCKPIKVNTDYEKKEDEELEKIKESEDDKKIGTEIKEKEIITSQVISENLVPSEDNTKESDEKIILNKKRFNQEEKVYITKQENIRLYLVYGFSVFCLVVIILLALRKL